jgi:flagellar motor switch protein FliN/FliY
VSDGTQAEALLAHVTLTVTVELGQCTMHLREILEIAAGSVVALDRPACDPVDVLVNGALLARGELVAVDDCYAVRISELVAQAPGDPGQPARDRGAGTGR